MSRKTKIFLLIFGLVAIAVLAKLLITKRFSEDERRFVELSLCLIYGIAWSLDRFNWKQRVALPIGKFGYFAAISFGLLIATAFFILYSSGKFTPFDFMNIALVAVPIWAVELLLRMKASKA